MTAFKHRLIKVLDHCGLTSKMTRKDFRDRIAKYASEGKTLDVASGGYSIFAEFFPHRVAVDIQASPGVDVVADVHNLSMFADASFDTVLCMEGLEHFYDPKQAVSEMTRVLRHGGALILSTRFIFPLHEMPHDYFRFTEYGLRHLLRDYDILELQEDGNTMETLAVLYQRIGYQCTTLWWKPLKLLWLVQAKMMPLFAKMLTKEYGDVAGKMPVRHIMTSGYLIIAKKR